MYTRLSVNVNKIATIRNARGGNNPDLIKIVKKIESLGADGITVHPRPDERHITTKDVYEIAEVITTEFNVEGFPDERFLKIINDIRPNQVTLVPDAPNTLTSNRGWNYSDLDINLNLIIEKIKKTGSKVSLFIDPSVEMVRLAVELGADRVELYTGLYAESYQQDKESVILKYIESADYAIKNDLEVNAGHDLDLINLEFFKQAIPALREVSIGHALVCDSLIYGLEKTIQLYLSKLK